jgi:soluble lytic murein transglycosylase-like protein
VAFFMNRSWPVFLVISFLLLPSSPAIGEENTVSPRSMVVLPYVASSKALAAAEQALRKGRFKPAIRHLAKAKKVPRSVRTFMTARVQLAAGKTRAAVKLLSSLAKGDSTLAPLAAWKLVPLVKKASDRQKYLRKAAEEPSFCGPSLLAVVDYLATKGNAEEARETLLDALACLPDAKERANAVLARLSLLGESAERCEKRLLHERYFFSSFDRTIKDRLAALWGAEIDDLAFLSSLLDGSPRKWRKVLARLDKQQGRDFDVAMLKGLLAKQLRRRKKEAALPWFERAHRLAGSPLRQAMALYFLARTQESLDRDLAAKDSYAELLRRSPEFPLRRKIRLRMATIAIREGQPLIGAKILDELMGQACPGEDLAEGLWLMGFIHYLSGSWDAAEESWAQLESKYFFKRQSVWVFFGTMARFWRGKAMLAANRKDECHTVWMNLALDFSGDYYGVLAAARLRQQGIELPEPQPAVLEVSPLRVPEKLTLPAEYAPAVAYFRMGLWNEAFEALRARIAQGTGASGAGWLMASAFFRVRGMGEAASFRRRYACLPPPWGSGARAWRASAPLAFLSEMAVARGVSGLHGALMAAIIRFESNFNPKAVSKAGAIGLIQVKKNTGTHVSVPCLGGKPVTTRELLDPERNAILGSYYVQELVYRHHDNWAVALAAYNAGPGTARWWLSRFAGMSSDAFVEQITYPNTMGYVKRIIGLVPIYWSLFHPVLEPGGLDVALPLHIPEDTRPFLDETGGRCDPAVKAGKQNGGKP